MKEALESESKFEPLNQQTSKMLKAEKIFSRSKKSSNKPKLDEVIGSFLLSKRAKKYAIGLTQHCALLRQASTSENWRYLGNSVPQQLLKPIQSQKDTKCK